MRLCSDLENIVGEVAVQKDRFGLAVSGGCDSMALLYLAHRLLGKRIAAATVDHQLRVESSQEAEQVALFCAQNSITHHILRPLVPIVGSLQAKAREIRYFLLDEWRKKNNLDWLLTAHHADDQLETVLMRLNRGSGVRGLAAIRARNRHSVRPLLGWRKSELVTIVERESLPFVCDPSNEDERFDRTRMRNLLKNFHSLDRLAAVRSASALDKADQALDWMAHYLVSLWPDHEDAAVLRNDNYPDELFRRIILNRLKAHQSNLKVKGAALDRLMQSLHNAAPAMIGDLVITAVASPPCSLWRIHRAKRRKPRGNCGN